eukprot:2980645-Amphidinium_carterae.1
MLKHSLTRILVELGAEKVSLRFHNGAGFLVWPDKRKTWCKDFFKYTLYQDRVTAKYVVQHFDDTGGLQTLWLTELQTQYTGKVWPCSSLLHGSVDFLVLHFPHGRPDSERVYYWCLLSWLDKLGWQNNRKTNLKTYLRQRMKAWKGLFTDCGMGQGDLAETLGGTETLGSPHIRRMASTSCVLILTLHLLAEVKAP